MIEPNVKTPFIGVQMESPLDGVSSSAIRNWARVAMQDDLKDVCIRITSEEESKNLNQRYRNIDKPTNVLAFPTDNSSNLGDVVICSSVATKESKQQGKTLQAHMAHLVVHAILHLNGLDHESPSDAQTMEALEIDILDSIGVGNPYE